MGRVKQIGFPDSANFLTNYFIAIAAIIKHNRFLFISSKSDSTDVVPRTRPIFSRRTILMLEGSRLPGTVALDRSLF